MVGLTLLFTSVFVVPVSEASVYFANSSSISDKGKAISSQLKQVTESLLNENTELISSKTASALSGKSNLIIAIGAEALKEVLSGPGDAPIVTVFASKASYHHVLQSFKQKNKRPLTAIYSDPDPAKQVALIKVLYGKTGSAAIISSQSSQIYIPEYQDASKRFGVRLSVLKNDAIKSSADFIRLTKNVAFLILLKDKHLFATIELDKILLSSYDINQQGVIGYSRGLVKKGGAATTYSSLPDIAGSIANQVKNQAQKSELDSPNYTSQFKVSLNKYVLRSLGLVIDNDEDEILRQIVSMMQEASTKK